MISIFDVIRLRRWDVLRAWLQLVVPVLILALQVTHAELWIGLAAAVLSPVLALANSSEGWRTWFYGVVAAVQALLLGLDLATQVQIDVWVPVITAILGGSVASANVRNKSTQFPPLRLVPKEPEDSDVPHAA